MAQKDNPLLEPSPYEEDRGAYIGKNPKQAAPEFLMEHGACSLPAIQAIRQKCLDCCGFSPGEVRKCVATTCPLWAFRMGTDPFRGKR